MQNQRAKYNTTHKLGSKTIVARNINNNRINEYLSTIESYFTEADLYKKTLTSPALKEYVNTSPGGIKIEEPEIEVNLTLDEKTIIFLTSKELQHFYKFEFTQNKAYLERAKDVFCFMAFTSLRYSDLQSLKKPNVADVYLKVITQKTNDRLRFSLTHDALCLIEKYKSYDSPKIYPVTSNQKLNDYLKEAAELAGLDRVVVETYYIGNQLFENEYKFYETISCHDARRNFVSCSIALDTPVTVVMSCTGHADYESMKPYIEVADETQKIQMNKWNTHQYKSQIIDLLDKTSES